MRGISYCGDLFRLGILRELFEVFFFIRVSGEGTGEIDGVMFGVNVVFR